MTELQELGHLVVPLACRPTWSRGSLAVNMSRSAHYWLHCGSQAADRPAGCDIHIQTPVLRQFAGHPSWQPRWSQRSRGEAFHRCANYWLHCWAPPSRGEAYSSLGQLLAAPRGTNCREPSWKRKTRSRRLFRWTIARSPPMWSATAQRQPSRRPKARMQNFCRARPSDYQAVDQSTSVTLLPRIHVSSKPPFQITSVCLYLNAEIPNRILKPALSVAKFGSVCAATLAAINLGPTIL